MVCVAGIDAVKVHGVSEAWGVITSSIQSLAAGRTPSPGLTYICHVVNIYVERDLSYACACAYACALMLLLLWFDVVAVVVVVCP